MKQVHDIAMNRDMFDHADDVKARYAAQPGLSKEVVEKISKDKNEPEWMLKLRLKGLELFNKTPMPKWGPDLSRLDINKIIFYSVPDAEQSKSWDDVPEEIKKTFDKLGIPEAEKRWLSGVGAQYDSTVLYHNLRKDLEEKGVIFEDMDVALQKYPELVKEHFMTKCIPVSDHKFIMLHAATWSGGTFIFVPKGVKVDTPLQAYFRMNAKKGGQFEHTLIIADEGSEISYIEGCFTKGTMITTNPSYKPIEDIRVGDKVLTHDGEYKRVYKVYERPPYSGNLCEIDVWGDSTARIRCTDDHPILIVRRKKANEKNKQWTANWIQAKNVNEKDYVLFPINRKVTSNEYMDFEVPFKRRKEIKRMRLDNDFFRLIGYYLAEGSISANSYLNISFGVGETEYINDVKQILKKMGVKKIYEFVHKKNNGLNLVVGDAKLARVFKQFGTSANKKGMPLWALQEDPEKQKELIIGLFRGDGNYFKQRCKSGFKEVIRLNTVSEKLAKQAKEVLLRLNIFAFINRRNRKKENRQTMYTVGITGNYMELLGGLLGIKVDNVMNNKKRATRFYIDNMYAYVPVRSVRKKEVKYVKVYNFAVDDNESYVANQIIAHNCSSPRYSENSLHAGCVELYVKKGARLRYSSVENWSRNTYNLNTKRAVVEEEGIIEWIGGNMGSQTTMLYPSSVLIGRGARADHLGIAFAGKGQHQDTGSKVVHMAPNTSSTIRSKSISKDGGICSYRGLLKINHGAKNAVSNVQCDGLILDKDSVSNTYPTLNVNEDDVTVAHEATVGKIGDDEIFYLMSRGLSEEQATQLIVSGFIEPIVKKLDLEYAIELNKLIELEMENAVG